MSCTTSGVEAYSKVVSGTSLPFKTWIVKQLGKRGTVGGWEFVLSQEAL